MAEGKSEQDKKLIKGCLRGDQSSQKSLYNLYSGKMYAVCMRYAGNSDEAKDLLQEGFIKVFNNLGKFKFEGSFEGWIRRIVVNNAIEVYRKKAKRDLFTSVEDLKVDSRGEEPQLVPELKDLLKCIAELPTGYRTVFNLYVVEGYPHKEIGEMLEITESTSKTQLRKARLLLQDKIKKLDIGPE